jgi:hypothetical protein
MQRKPLLSKTSASPSGMTPVLTENSNSDVVMV